MSAMKSVVLTSENKIKVEALKHVLVKSALSEYKVVAHTQTLSAFPHVEQPINDGTNMCCLDRIRGQRLPQDKHVFSLENGIFESNGKVFDVCVLIHAHNNKERCYYSMGIPIDSTLFKQYLAAADPVVQESIIGYTTTFGAFVSKHFGCSSSNWMKDVRFGGIDRRTQIDDVLNKWLLDYHTEQIQDFPRKGIKFLNIESILDDPVLLPTMFDMMEAYITRNFDLARIDYIGGIGGRGFYFAVALARSLRKAFLPVRKLGKVPSAPGDTVFSSTYDSEYKKDNAVGMRERIKYNGKHILLMDDLFATGGTANGSIDVCEQAGLVVEGFFCLYGIPGLKTAAQKNMGSRYKHVHVLIESDLPSSLRQTALKPFHCSFPESRALQPKFIQADWDFKNYGDKEVIVLASSKDESLAKHIAETMGVPFNIVHASKFGNGETRVELGSSVRGRQIIYINRIRTGLVNDDLVEAQLVLRACTLSGSGEITVMMPYLPYSRSDKRDKPGVPIAAAWATSLFEEYKNLVCWDLHAGQIQGFNKQGFHNIYIIRYMCEYLYTHYLSKFKQQEWNKQFVLVSPDAGSMKRTEAYSKILEIDVLMFHKTRDHSKPGKVETSMLLGDGKASKGKTAILIDDMADSMGTMCAASKALVVDSGMKDVIVVATHGIFSGPAIERINHTTYIKAVIVTDSIPQEETHSKCPKLEVLSIAPLASRVLDCIFAKKSISQLFK